MAVKVLFICKKNEVYSFVTYTRRSSGLFNSTEFIAQSLRANGITATVIEVTDNNDIDKEVTRFKPDLVIIEALWVVPEKFDILMQLHPRVQWFVHMHSGIPFLALEGIAMQWLVEYADRGVGIIANSRATHRAFESILPPDSSLYLLSNIYHGKSWYRHTLESPPLIVIACLGAIRPMKNQLIQAVSAIEFAKRNDLRLQFIINGTRIETGGEPVLKNLKALFAATPNTELIIWPWLEPEELKKKFQIVDLGMQVSLTETFNVTTADYVTAGIPVVTSDDVEWVSRFSQAKDDSVEDIVRVMSRALKYPCLVGINQKRLKKHSKKAAKEWLEFVRQQ